MPVSVGIVGAAGRGKSFITPLVANGAEICAICDPNIEGIRHLSGVDDGVPRFSDFDEMLEKSSLDAVVVATPQHIHVRQVIPALKRGLHVLRSNRLSIFPVFRL